jgi:SLT domain-containing protein
MSVVAGQALKAKDTLMPMGEDGFRSLSGVGKAALGAGILVAGFTVITTLMGAKAADAKQEVDDLAGRMKTLGLTAEEAAKQGITAYVNGNDKLKDAMKLAGLTADDLRNAVVKGGDALSTFKDRIVAAAKANNDNADAGPRVLLAAQNVTNEIDKQHNAYVTLTGEVKATDAATKAIGETEKERADRIKATTDALKAQQDAEQAARLEALRSIDADFNYRASVQDTKTALEEYTKKMKDHKLSTEEQKVATDAMVMSMAGTASSYAKSKGDAEGSKAAIDDMITSLYIQAAAAAPGSDLQKGLGDYILKLEAINRGLTPEAMKYLDMNNGVNMHMPSSPKVPNNSPNAHGATGGIVTQPTNALIGEAGPEMVIPLSSMPGASPLPSTSGSGASINLTVHAGLGTDGAAVGQQIVNLLKTYQRTNGPFSFS